MSPLISRALKVILALAGTAAVTPFVARWFGRRAFGERVSESVEKVMRDAAGARGVVTEDDLADLPKPVREYLRFAGVVGRERLSTTTLAQRGRMRIAPTAPWQDVTATHTMSTSPAAFAWHATVATGVFAIELLESYLGGKSDVVAKLASVVPLFESSGEEMDQSALVRYLAELPYTPTALVDEVRWEPLDSERARVFLTDGELEVSAICTFDTTSGALINFVAERWRDEDGVPRKCAWSMPYEEYCEIDGFVIPRHTACIWHDGDEEFEYLRLEVLAAGFDIASYADSTASEGAHEGT